MNKYLSHKGYRLLPVSLLCLVLLLAGCATKQDVIRVEEKVNQIRIDQKLVNAKLEKVDSLITGGADADNRLRAEIRTSIDDLNTQISQLQNQINDLNQMLNMAVQRIQSGNTGSTPPIVQVSDSVQAMAAEDTTAVEQPSVDCHNLWDSAFKDVRRGQYDVALSGFNDYLKYCPNGPLADNTQYWIGECYNEMEMYDKAITEYNKLLSTYPETKKKASAIYKLGRCYEKQDNKTKALEYFLMLQNEYPETVEYSQVKDKITEWQSGNDN